MCATVCGRARWPCDRAPRDCDTGRHLVFSSNNFLLPALTIAQLYRRRWQIELFFKWIKQHLRTKSFLGTTPNAVKTQIWIAISVYVLMAIARAELKLGPSLSEIQQILSITLFDRTPIREALTTIGPQTFGSPCHKQLLMWDL